MAMRCRRRGPLTVNASGDSRRLVYFTSDGWQLVAVDTVTRKRTVIDVRLPAAATGEVFAIAPDRRTIYYGAARSEADIWIVEQK